MLTYQVSENVLFFQQDHMYIVLSHRRLFLLLKIERDPSIESVRDTKISTKLRIAFFVLYCTNQGVYRILG